MTELEWADGFKSIRSEERALHSRADGVTVYR